MVRQTHRCHAIGVAITLVAVLAASCSRGKPLYPVRGEVFFEGHPAAGALVVLHPTDDSSPEAIRPSGYVESDGSLKLTSYLSPSRFVAEGAPAGEYIVTVSWLPTDVKEYLSKHPNSTLPDKLGGRFSQPSSSTLRAKVLEGPTELPRIELKKDGPTISTWDSRTKSASARATGNQFTGEGELES